MLPLTGFFLAPWSLLAHLNVLSGARVFAGDSKIPGGAGRADEMWLFGYSEASISSAGGSSGMLSSS